MEALNINDFVDPQQTHTTQFDNDILDCFKDETERVTLKNAMQTLQKSLSRGNTVEDMIDELSVSDIQRITSLSEQQSLKLFSKLCKQVYSPAPENVFTMLQDRESNSKLSLGCPILNEFLEGGISRNGITEISGISASGKTQICLQLLIQVQLPLNSGGFDARGYYLSTEGPIPTDRLQQIIGKFNLVHPWTQQYDMKENILVSYADTTLQLWEKISIELPILIVQRDIKLVVIDSLASLFRFEEFGGIARAQILWKIASKLKKLSHQFKIPILCINQVSDKIYSGINNWLPQSSAKVTVPSLGLSWSNCVNTRIFLSRTTRTLNNEDLPPAYNENYEVIYEQNPAKKRKIVTENNPITEQTIVRKMEVSFAPDLPQREVEFIVDELGVRGI